MMCPLPGYYTSRGPYLSKSLYSMHHRVSKQSIPTYNPTAKGIPEQACRKTPTAGAPGRGFGEFIGELDGHLRF